MRVWFLPVEIALLYSRTSVELSMDEVAPMTLWHEERLLVDGDLVLAEGGRRYPTLDPSTAEPLGAAADASVGDAQRAVAAARRAFDTTDWATDRAFRGHCLRQLHAGLVAHREDLRHPAR